MQTKSRAEVAADLLGTLSADAPAGCRLGTKEELRARASVSVGTFNEALRLAKNRGVVDVRSGPGGGIFAASQSGMVRLANLVLSLDTDARTVEQAIRLRDALDPLLVEDAIEHATEAEVESLRDAAIVIEKLEHEGDELEVTQAIWYLHGLIADISPNEMVASIYRGLLDLLESHTVGFTSHQGPSQDRVRLHRDIVEAIAARDYARAAELMDDHRMSVPRRDAAPVAT